MARRPTSRLVATIGAFGLLSLVAYAALQQGSSSAAAGDVSITALNCDSSPEYVRIKNFDGSSQSLAGFRIQSDPSQDYDLAAHVGSIAAGQTLEFQSGSGAADNAGAGIYKLTGSNIYRNGDPTDYARLVRSGAPSQQVACGSTPSTPSPSASPTKTPTPAPTPSPTATFPPGTRLQGDVDCSLAVNSVDALKLLRHVASLDVSQNLPCPTIGEEIASIWGDVDCNLLVNSVDALKVLRHVAALSVSQDDPCPKIGTPVDGDDGGVLRVHHIDVEQGDAALIVAPNGQVAMIDDGRWTACSNTVSYVQALGIAQIDYHFATHYDADHIGCLDDLADAGITVGTACYDRGGSKDTDVFNDYVAACGAKRQTVTKGQVVTLDAVSANPVTITVVDLNGAGISTSEENALGVVLKLTYGAFDEVFAGDLPGESPDIESVVGPEVGNVDVCTVNHHGSASSTNNNWLASTDPEVCVLSVGANPYGHPTAEALARLHGRGTMVYWTNAGSGAAPDQAYDKVGGDLMIEARPGTADSYRIIGSGISDEYPNQ